MLGATFLANTKKLLLSKTQNNLMFLLRYKRPKTAGKGQLISKCLFGVIVLTKKIENIVRISNLKVCIASLRLPGSFWGLPVGFLINDITQGPRKLQKFQGRNPYNILGAISVETMKPKRHFEIN